MASASQPEVEPKKLERGVAKSCLSLAGTLEDSPVRSVWNDAQSVHDMSLNLGSPGPEETMGHESSAHVLPTPGVPLSVEAARCEESSPVAKKVTKDPRDKVYFRILGLKHILHIYV